MSRLGYFGHFMCYSTQIVFEFIGYCLMISLYIPLIYLEILCLCHQWPSDCVWDCGSVPLRLFSCCAYKVLASVSVCLYVCFTIPETVHLISLSAVSLYVLSCLYLCALRI